MDLFRDCIQVGFLGYYYQTPVELQGLEDFILICDSIASLIGARERTSGLGNLCRKTL